MENIKIKTYVTPQKLKEFWSEKKLVYTVQVYTSGRIWEDNIISQSLYIHMNHVEFKRLMKEKFDSCIECDLKLFFPTKQICEEAVEFIDSLITLSKLLS